MVICQEVLSHLKNTFYIGCAFYPSCYMHSLCDFNKAFPAYLLKILRNMQWRAALCILRGFLTSPSLSIEAIASLILIYLYFQKLSERLQLRTQLLPVNYIINSLLESRHSSNNNCQDHWWWTLCLFSLFTLFYFYFYFSFIFYF